MRVGALDQRLTIQTPTYAASQQSSQGVASFATLATVWGAAKALAGAEALESGAVVGTSTYEFEVRQRSDVTPKMRVVWTPYGGSARTFEIHGVTFGDRRADRMTLHCGETA
jgi:SPP1 family predicted phage head-tail adaptor